jgi:hypothetical protein
MGRERIGLVAVVVAGVVLGGLIATAGCDGVDDTVSGGDEAELQLGGRFHHRHRVPDAGAVTGGATAGTNGGTVGPTGGPVGPTGGPAVDAGTVAGCDVCTKAQQCCFAVGVQTCTFSAATCSSMVGDAQPAYINACLTQISLTSSAWAGNPPAACR